MTPAEEARRGWELLDLEEYQSAEDHFRQALEAEPLGADALTGMGAIYRVYGDVEQAHELLEMAIAQAERLLPRSKRHTDGDEESVRPYVRALYQLALTFVSEDAFALAQPALEEVVAWDGTAMGGRALFLLGLVLQQLGRLDEATHAYLEAAERVPEAHYSAGLTLFLSGRQREAERFWRMGVAKRPLVSLWVSHYPQVRPLPVRVPSDLEFTQASRYVEHTGWLWTPEARAHLAGLTEEPSASSGRC